MDLENVVQFGGAVKHNPLPPLSPLVEQDGLNVEGTSSARQLAVPTIGGFIGNGQLSWRAIGPTLEIFDPLSCTRQAAWTFGTIFHNSSAKVTSVCGIGVGTITHVAVGIDLGREKKPQGMVGILSLRRSRITRAFHFQYKVMNICMITGGEKLVDVSTLKSELQHCRGLLAVATSHAFLYLVDIALDIGAEEITSDEVSPASYTPWVIPDPNPEVNRNRAIKNKLHQLLCLSESMNSGGTFRLLGADDKILYETSCQSVLITSMTYVPQLASLIVGYNFGSFQVINLSLITIDCASPYEENMAPVYSVTYQEPENDPRSFVYLWICYSFAPSDSMQRSLDARDRDKNASCTLYAMHYEKKEWNEGYGLWYQSPDSISPRFTFDLFSLFGQDILTEGFPCKMFSAVTVVGATPSNAASPLNCIGPTAAAALTSVDEDSGPVPELSLSLFCWEAHFVDKGRIVLKHYIAIFDINQWYQAQMPQRFCFEGTSLSPFMSFHCLDKVPNSLGENILSAIPRLGSWSRHASKSKCENDWYPSSLSYDLILLTSQSLVTFHCSSIQQRVICTFNQHGPKAIVYPQAHHTACILAGLLPQDSISAVAGSSVVQERENLLNVALEYDLLPLLIQCTLEFSEGLFSHLGCSLEVILQWAWNKVHYYKSSYDALCAPLFKSSPETLSDESLFFLHQNLSYLSHISTIITAIRDNASDITSFSEKGLDGRVQVVKIFRMHLQAILWFYHCGLLPQYIADETLDESSVPFPATALQNSYNTRYSEVKKLSSSLKGTDLLLIDSLLEEVTDELHEIWEKDDRSIEGVYPPPTLQSLLSMYMLPGLSLNTKHRIVQYLFLDLAAILADSYASVVEELVKFPSSFSLSPSLIKITQAFWLIDHGFFQEGLDVLIHPLVNPDDITPSQQRRITKAFLFQGEEKLALAYNQIRQPPHEELEDVRLKLTVLLANGRIREAFHYQRLHRVRLNAKDLLNHFFVGCEHVKRLEALVHLPLSVMEEEAFVAYLQKSSHSAAQDILLSYYLQQSRYSELNIFQGNATSLRQSARSALVTGYLSHLPSYQNKTRNSASKPTKTFYQKPKPLSACIRQSTLPSTPHSKYTNMRLNELQLATGQKDSRPNATTFTPFRSRLQRREAIGSWNKEMGIINDSSLIDDEINKDITTIVFPTMLESEGEEGEPSSSKVSNKSNRHMSFMNSPLGPTTQRDCDPLKENVAYLMEEVLRKSIPDTPAATPTSKRVSRMSEVLSLLKTPPVVRSLSSRQKEIEAYSETPQSILKVRKILQRSLSPEINGMEDPTSLPSRRSVTKSFKEPEETSRADLTSGTPKQLRFHLPSGLPSAQTESSSVNLLHEFDMVAFRNKSQVLNSSLQNNSSDDLQNSSESPSPRKPLPGYVEREQISNSLLECEAEPMDDSLALPGNNDGSSDSPLEEAQSQFPSPSKLMKLSTHSQIEMEWEDPMSESSQNVQTNSTSSPLPIDKFTTSVNELPEDALLAEDEHKDSFDSVHYSIDSFHSFEDSNTQNDNSLLVDNQPTKTLSPSKSPKLKISESLVQDQSQILSSSSEPLVNQDKQISPVKQRKILESPKISPKSHSDHELQSKIKTMYEGIDSTLSKQDTVDAVCGSEFEPEEAASSDSIPQIKSTLNQLENPDGNASINALQNIASVSFEVPNKETTKPPTDIETKISKEDNLVCPPSSKTLVSINETCESIYGGLDPTFDVHLDKKHKKNLMEEYLKNSDDNDNKQFDLCKNNSLSVSKYVINFSDSEDENELNLCEKSKVRKSSVLSLPKSQIGLKYEEKQEAGSQIPQSQNYRVSGKTLDVDSMKDQMTHNIPNESEANNLESTNQAGDIDSQLILRFSDSEEEDLTTATILPVCKEQLSSSLKDGRDDVSSCVPTTENISEDVTKEDPSEDQDTKEISNNLIKDCVSVSTSIICTETIKEDERIDKDFNCTNNNSNDLKLCKESSESCTNQCQEEQKAYEMPSLDDQHISDLLPTTFVEKIDALSSKILDDLANLTGNQITTPKKETPSTPIRRSRRLSGIANDAEESTVQLSGRVTPSRRKRRLSGMSLDGDDNAEASGRLTPVRRSRRLSGLSFSEDEDAAPTPIQTPKRGRKVSSGNTIVSTPTGKRGRRPSGSSETPIILLPDDTSDPVKKSSLPSNEEPIQETSVSLSDNNMQLAQTTPMKLSAKDAIIVPPSQTPRGSPGRSRRQRSGTPDIPVRRSARLSSTPDVLGTIVEEGNVEKKDASPNSEAPLHKPLKINKYASNQSTPNRSQRKSLNQSLILDPNLETIAESAESPSLPEEVSLRTALPSAPNKTSPKENIYNGTHPEPKAETRTRRRPSANTSQESSTPIKKIQTRQRRGSATNTPLKNPDVSFVKIYEDTPQLDTKSIDNEDMDEVFIAPMSSKSTISDTTKLIKKEGPSLRRKSLHSLTIADDYETSMEEPRLTRRKSRIAKETPSSVVRLKRKSRLEDLDDFSGQGEVDFDQSDAEQQSNLPQVTESPEVEFNLIKVPHLDSLTSKRVAKRKSSYIKRTTTRISAPKDYIGFSDDEEGVQQPKTKKPRKKSSTENTKSAEENDFVFSKPDVIREVTPNLSPPDSAELNPNFVFSPPHEEKVKKSSATKLKKKPAEKGKR